MERLPPTPYLNNIDYSLVCALAIMGLIVVSHCITNRIFKAGNEELAIIRYLVYGYGCSYTLELRYFCL